MHAVAGNEPAHEVARILERGGVRGEDDVAKQGNLRVAERGAVDGADHGDFDVQQAGQDTFSFPVGLVPFSMRPFGGAGGGAWGAGKDVARAGHDDDAVLGVGANVGEDLGKLGMGPASPLQGPAIGVEGHLQDPVAAFHADALVFIGILVQRSHISISRRCHRVREYEGLSLGGPAGL